MTPYLPPVDYGLPDHPPHEGHAYSPPIARTLLLLIDRELTAASADSHTAALAP